MALNKTVRTACERLLERHEDEVVTLYYEAGEAMRRGGGSDVSQINESIKYLEDKLNSIS